MFKFISSFFKGHERTVKAKKNIIVSFGIKGVSIIIGFLMIRITLHYLDKTTYGVWLTLTSFISWFSFFEIGLGNGLKNRLAEALAKKQYKLAKIYVSTTYAILFIISSIIGIIFFIFNSFLDWTIILNTDKSLMNELSLVSLIVFGSFLFNFVLKLISTVLVADQRPAVGNTFGPVGNLISLILIYVLTLTTDGSLFYLAWILSVVPVLVLLSATIYFYNSDYKKIAPSIKWVNFKYAGDLFNLGLKFFVIQISTLIMFQSSNFIIAHFFGPAEVTPFQIAYKLFSVLLMIFSIVVSPFWAAYTEAWTLKDVKWIKNSTKTLFRVWLGLVALGIFLFIISDTFFELWLSKKEMESIHISYKLKLSLLFYFLLFTFGGIYNMFINGVGKLAVQMYSLLIGAILFIPMSIFFIQYLGWGIESVVIASIIANFYSPLIAPIQYRKIILNKAHGIWNK
ncbi:MATE family efflux transporter [Aureibaculum sp. A20]|uniref:MATE family efflux transporter n=1 Tax=Aureibaculum flavum TaxID=2795986 RepID=A0ABS0WKX3_9FLAO|nr:MATE family efflux transporter [Aureibaculum flavum]MBJ2172617.1 MATE family efflux transporter [Aureibaculum flavum]